MARFSDFLGRRVLVHYRAGTSPIPACGVLVGDTGRAVFLEENLAEHSGVKQFRWEIPYDCIGSMRMDDDEPLVDAAPAAD